MNKYRVSWFDLKTAPKPMIRELKKLTLRKYRNHGGMYDMIVDACYGYTVESHAGIITSMGEIVGWVAAAREFEFSTQYSVQFFVKPEHRNKGIGSALYRSAKRKFPKQLVSVTDKNNAKFFIKKPVGDLTKRYCQDQLNS